MKVTVIDYGLSNLLSVRHAFAHFGAETLLTSDPGDVLAAEKLVLPGVGAFKEGRDGLARLGLIEPIRQKAAAGTPLLGICLGMQMLFDESEEFGLHKGLGLIPGRVVKLPDTDVDGHPQKVPHISWDPLYPGGGRTDFSGTALAALKPGEECYFIHSYEAKPVRDEDRLADTVYGGRPGMPGPYIAIIYNALCDSAQGVAFSPAIGYNVPCINVQRGIAMFCDLLVGSTGFVGGNLLAKHTFAAECHSSDITAQYGTRPDLCVYAGVPAAMFLANADPEADLAVMRAARENIRQIAPKRLILISSIAVLADSRGVYEDSPAQDTEALPAYGKNRLQLERWVREDFPDALIVRLPALYGAGIRKNFLFDLHTITPAMLRPEKYSELAAKSPLVKSAYTLADNGFYKLNGTADPAALRTFFAANDFNALAFTDARSRYQFYNLGRLWSDMEAARAADVKLLHLCTPPVSAAEVYTAVTGKADWHNELPKPPFDYDLRSRHAALLGGSSDYLCTKQQELDDITRFMRSWRD